MNKEQKTVLIYLGWQRDRQDPSPRKQADCVCLMNGRSDPTHKDLWVSNI